ncbi:hypothetical protein FBEOM_608 [Fusarium beomiforme]|uniref:Uncharacterized protein n=1 Tax=Fusarium beomiforme TaxID=44412 RepID=A0A9P5AVE7_9HYPO|nr:hypothetical protein FBEOM_608 [Fusarium beomiforme]
MNAKQLSAIANVIFFDLHFGEHKARNLRQSTAGEMEANAEDEQRVQCLQEYVGIWADTVFMDYRRSDTVQYLTEPYIRVEIPIIESVGPLNKFLAGLFTPGYTNKESKEVVRAIPNRRKTKRLWAKVFHQHKKKTAQLEYGTLYRRKLGPKSVRHLRLGEARILKTSILSEKNI